MTTPAVPLYDYQRAWFLDRSRFKAGMFARQTGKTFTTTLEIVDDCFDAWSRDTRARWIILSRGERQAREAMESGIKLHAKAYGLAIEDYSEFDWTPEDKRDDIAYKALEVVLPGGSRITALPANPDTARGFTANVFLDEFAIHKDSRAIWAALFPVISAPGLKLRVTSTPKGKGNKFYELMTATDSVWSRHIADIHRAVADGLPRDIEELRAGLNDDEVWQQEYELQWADEASAWLTYDLITAVESDDAGDPSKFRGGNTYIGNDIARRRDLWCAWVWEEVGDVLTTREVVTRRGISFREQDQILDDLVARYNPVRIAMDQGGMGEKPVEDAKRRYGELRVDGVLLQGASRLNIATIGKQRFEDRRCRIPAGDIALRADLHKVKKIVGETGNVRLVADSDAEGHADRFWAAFLGLAAASSDAVPAAGETVNDGRRRTDHHVPTLRNGVGRPGAMFHRRIS